MLGRLEQGREVRGNAGVWKGLLLTQPRDKEYVICVIKVYSAFETDWEAVPF